MHPSNVIGESLSRNFIWLAAHLMESLALRRLGGRLRSLALGFRGERSFGCLVLANWAAATFFVVCSAPCALGVTGATKSPTFSLIESYLFSEYTLHHVDLYRLSDDTELEAVGFRDYLLPDTVCCVEWPTRAPALAPYVDVTFELELQGAGRRLTVEGFSQAGHVLLSCLRRAYV